MQLGYIGLGNMGAPMAQNLIKAGHDVLVYDIDQSKIETVVQSGATAGESGEDVAQRADILFTSLPEPRHVAAALPAWIEAMRPGSIWVDLTTNDKDVLFEIAHQAYAKDVGVVESPVTGAVDGARLAKLTFFVGGKEESIAKAIPYLAASYPFNDHGKSLCLGETRGHVKPAVVKQIRYR